MSEFGLGRIGQIALRVHDVGEAVEFYRDRLGMKLLFEVPGMAFFDCAGIRLMVGLPEEEHDHPGSILYFEVEDIQQAHAVLEDRGVEFLEAPRAVAELDERVLWLGFFEDPWSNVLALMSEVPKAES